MVCSTSRVPLVPVGGALSHFFSGHLLDQSFCRRTVIQAPAHGVVGPCGGFVGRLLVVRVAHLLVLTALGVGSSATSRFGRYLAGQLRGRMPRDAMLGELLYRSSYRPLGATPRATCCWPRHTRGNNLSAAGRV